MEDESYLIVALVGERIAQSDGSIEVGTIVMGERQTRVEAEAECTRRNDLARARESGHAGREYIVMSTAEYHAICHGEWSRD
jgi:hypothetical protein